MQGRCNHMISQKSTLQSFHVQNNGSESTFEKFAFSTAGELVHFSGIEVCRRVLRCVVACHRVLQSVVVCYGVL